MGWRDVLAPSSARHDSLARDYTWAVHHHANTKRADSQGIRAALALRPSPYRSSAKLARSSLTNSGCTFLGIGWPYLLTHAAAIPISWAGIMS